jgi:predicted heme/steroid binding protein/rhodanese-related sulfurtransferase
MFRPLSFLILFFTAILASGGYANQPTLPKAPYISTQTVKEWQAQGKKFTFVDVRRADEFDQGHLPGAINIPYDELEKRKAEVPQGQPAIFYCTYSSWRAPYAANLLADFGYDNVYTLEGGASAWNAGGQVIDSQNPDVTPEIVPKPKDLEANFEHFPVREYQTKIDLTEVQLREFDGKDGRPAYVAINGIIYDVTQSRLWRGGEHDPSHGKAMAGRDLTSVLKDSPHGDKHFKYFPVVGKLVKE